MPKVVGEYRHHRKVCPHCDTMIEFNNSEIIVDSNGMRIVCPNCNYNIKF